MKPLFQTAIEWNNYRLLPPPTLSAVLTIEADIMMETYFFHLWYNYVYIISNNLLP